MGDTFGQVSADTEKLNGVRGQLDDQRKNVESAKAALVAPEGGMFGASARGEWMAGVVHRAHLGLERALDQNIHGLQQQSTAVHNAMKKIEGADVDAELQAHMLAEVLEVMSMGLVMFSPQEAARLTKGPKAV